MAEVWFYHLTQTSRDEALPTLVEKCVARDWRVAIQTPDEAVRDHIDAHLWAYRRDSFLVHGVDGDDPDLHPIMVTVASDNPNRATVRFQIDGTPPPEDIAAYERLLLVFDGGNEDVVQTARGQWKALKAAGHNLTYYKQTPEGRWEKAA